MLTRYILLSVGIVVVMIIMTLLFMSLSSVGDIYGQADKVNISIKDKMDTVFHKFDGSVINGVDFVNFLKKYEDEYKYKLGANYESNSERPTMEIVLPTNLQQGYNDYCSLVPEKVRLVTYITGVMDGDIAGPAKCEYHKLFDCDVTESENIYVITFSYH